MPPKQKKAGGGGDKVASSSSSSSPSQPPQREWDDDLQRDFERILSVGEECISESELKGLLLFRGRGSSDGGGGGFNLYDGFEPSGRMHIAQGVFKAMNVNKCTHEGTNGTFVFWVADWFALMNDKMGGDLDKIRTVGRYLIEVWKAAGMNLDHVVFKWASEEITGSADTYWPLALDVARRFNITRIKKCCQIMGRLEGSLTAAQVMYPIMQCTDVFFLRADVCQLGVDQRKVNMLAREYCDAAGRKRKPIVLSHHMLYGLKAGQEKMSKSDPDSAIFMEDSPEDVERKILNAYCPSSESSSPSSGAPGIAAAGDDGGGGDDEDEDAGKASMQLKEDKLKNPCLDYIQHIIFSPPGSTFKAGSTTYDDFAAVRSDFLNGKLSEAELKRGLIDSLNALLQPVRDHFANDPNAKELLDLVRAYKKETAKPSERAAARRLNLVELCKVPAKSHLVFAPLPSANPTLQEAIDLLVQLRVPSRAEGEGNRPRVLFLSDWSSKVCNACNADPKATSAYYEVLIASLNILDPQLMEGVRVLYQSDAILADPSNYWISVINVGRHFLLDDVMGGNLKDSDCVGNVIARLMRVADVAGVEPDTLAFSETDPDSPLEKSLIEQFFDAKLCGVPKPSVEIRTCPSIRLQPERESEALKTDNDEYFLLDDPKVSSLERMKACVCPAVLTKPASLSVFEEFSPANVFVLSLSRAYQGTWQVEDEESLLRTR